jgi:predicted DNA-binding protein YlxM (UPF0122 family)
MQHKAKRRERPNDSERSLDLQRKRLDLAQVWKLRVVNQLSYGEIARSLGVAKSSVHAALQRLHKLVPDPDVVKAYAEVRPTLLTAVEYRLMASLTDEEALQKASLNNRAYAFQQVFNARRLEDGKATGHLSVISRMLDETVGNLYKRPQEEKEATNDTIGKD